MTSERTYPGGLSELEFLRSYLDTTLRKPQAVADAIMRTSVLASQVERVLLTASIAEQLGEAARRMAHVFEALDDRTHAVARTLAGPLPGLDTWLRLARLAASLPPASLTARLSLDESATDYAERLRSLPELEAVGAAVSAHASRNPLLVVPGSGGHRPPSRFVYAAVGADAPARPDLELGIAEADAATLADLTAELCAVARGFLGTYLEARTGVSRHD